jgi:CubicO group peptidase (beta-lactamase class C family)
MPRLVTRKRAFWVFGVVIGAAMVFMAVWIVLAGPVTVFRILHHGGTNIDDFKHYPGRELHASESPFRFTRSGMEFAIPTTVLLEYGSEGELEQILEANGSIAFLIIQGNTILYERYFQGHTVSSLSQAFSVSKSFTSALIGMAIDDGYFMGVDQAITDFIPELAPQGFDEVRIRHLLTMTSGSSYVENDSPIGEHVILNFTTELEDQILTFTMERAPGEFFRYKSGDNALLALALDRALGDETITDYTQRRLWTPLGMEDGGIWTIDHEGDGLERTWCCLAASARDFAKLGRLFLDEGNWKGQQLLSADWVFRSTQIGQIPEDAWPDEYVSIGWWNYGYQWWLASREEGDFFGLGKDGQFLYVNPEADLIIVRLGWNNGSLRSGEWIDIFQAIADEVSWSKADLE